MNRNEMIGALCGMVLGDAYIGLPKKGKNAYLSMRHCKEQEEYLDFKMKILSQLCGVKKAEDDREGCLGIRVWTRCHPLLTQMRRWFYDNNVKRLTNKILYRLTPLGIAIWYMDDGYLGYLKKKGKVRGREIKIYTQNFTKTENQMIVDYFKNKHNIKWRIGRSNMGNKEYYHIATGAEEGKKFFQIIAPYIVKAMQYKLDMKYSYSSYAGRPFEWSMIQSELGSNVKTVTEMMTA